MNLWWDHEHDENQVLTGNGDEMADKQTATEHKSWPSMSKDELLKELERISAAQRNADQGGIGGRNCAAHPLTATGVSDVIGNVCREQIQQLKDKIEQSECAQAPALDGQWHSPSVVTKSNLDHLKPAPPDAELVERMLSAWYMDGATSRTEAMAAALHVAADALLGPVTDEEMEKFRSSWFANGGDWRENTRRILRTFSDTRRARLLAPAKTETIQERVEHILTKHFKTIGVVDAAAEIIATLKEGK